MSDSIITKAGDTIITLDGDEIIIAQTSEIIASMLRTYVVPVEDRVLIITIS